MPDPAPPENRITAGPRWSRRGLLTAGAVTGAGAFTAGLSGCGKGGSGGADDELKDKIRHPSDNFKEKGFPIVKNPITVQFMTKKPPEAAKDYNKVLVWKKYQKLTNITVDWGLVPTDSIEEKRNLALSSGDYPDAFYASGFGVRDLGKYGSQGVFIKLNDLIDKYMPNLKKLMEDNADIKQGMTFPDGSRYGLPLLIDPQFTAFLIEYTIWVRGDWLDKFDMEPPKTTQEYYRYLKKIKSKQPNGKDGAVPYGSIQEGNGLYAALCGAFGVATGGSGIVDQSPDDNDKARFFPISDGYKALLEYMHKLYSEGLIEKNIFSADNAKVWERMRNGTYGSISEISPYGLRGGKAKEFVPMPALKGPAGDQVYNNVSSSLLGSGYFVITDKCKHPVELARWADYFYSDEGAKLYFMGVEGKTYKETDDGVEYVDKIKHPKGGKGRDEARKPYMTFMGGGYGPCVLKEDYFKGAEGTEESIKATKVVEPHAQQALKAAMPPFTFTEDEFETLESVADDIEKYVSESRDKFISGDLKLSQWHTYVKKIKKMGLDDYMEVQQAAYDRFRKG